MWLYQDVTVGLTYRGMIYRYRRAIWSYCRSTEDSTFHFASIFCKCEIFNALLLFYYINTYDYTCYRVILGAQGGEVAVGVSLFSSIFYLIVFL